MECISMERKSFNQFSISKNIKNISILVLLFLGSISIYLNIKNNSEIKLMRLDYENLFNSYSDLNSSYYDLQNNATILQEYYDYIKLLYNDLYVDYSNLSGSYTDLYKDLDDINSLYSDSLINYGELQNTYLVLLEEYDNISDDLDEAIKLLNDIENLHIYSMLANQENLEIDSGNNENITYDISYAGFLEINFTSSEEIFIWVGSSAVEPVYYSRYPNYPNLVDHGSFQVPVAGSKVYVYFENPDQNSDTNIVYSIKYVY